MIMRTFLLILYLLGFGLCSAQAPAELQPGESPGSVEDEKPVVEFRAFKPGEWLKFRIHYGIFNASFATLHLKTDTLKGQKVFHAVGEGRTTGLARAFFKVDDLYESYFSMDSIQPLRFIRKIDEGGYTKDVAIDFDYDQKKAVVLDNKTQQTTRIDVHKDIQDLVSASYYLRNNYDPKAYEPGEFLDMDMLFDNNVYKFRLKYLGKEIVRTKFGKVECLKFRPYVQAGRIFKERESLTLWVSNDLNRIPIRIKADLAVGSLKADLDAFNGLQNQFKIIMRRR